MPDPSATASNRLLDLAKLYIHVVDADYPATMREAQRAMRGWPGAENRAQDLLQRAADEQGTGNQGGWSLDLAGFPRFLDADGCQALHEDLAGIAALGGTSCAGLLHSAAECWGLDTSAAASSPFDAVPPPAEAADEVSDWAEAFVAPDGGGLEPSNDAPTPAAPTRPKKPAKPRKPARPKDEPADPRPASTSDIVIPHDQVVGFSAQVLVSSLMDLPGIGESTVRQIIDFAAGDEDFLDLFEGGERRLRKVPGIGKKKAETMLQAFSAYGGKRGIMSMAQAELEKRERKRRFWRQARPWIVGATAAVWLGVAIWWSADDPDVSFFAALGWPFYLLLVLVLLLAFGSGTRRRRR